MLYICRRSLGRCNYVNLIIIILCLVLYHFFSRIIQVSKVLKAPKQPFWNDQCKGIKYILIWNDTLLFWKGGRSVFSTLNCPIRNCVFVRNEFPYNAYHSYFDGIVFPQHSLAFRNWPSVRLRTQLYIFATYESSSTEPVCDEFNDNFFNWTLTYKLDSHIPWTYFAVKDKSGTIIAPNLDVVWDDSYQNSKIPITPALKRMLSTKTKAAVWVVSHCRADSARDDYLFVLKEILLYFALEMDVYGLCAHRKCPNNDCDKLIKENYFFYLAFENSIVEDYVTEKVLNGYNNFAVPIVYGGANYSRFLPPGSYVDANNLNQYNLALLILKAVTNLTNYEQYFRWTHHYTIHSPTKECNPLCDLCAALHTDYAKNAPVIKKFRKWWMGNDGMKWCLSDAFFNESSRVNLDARHIYHRMYRHAKPTKDLFKKIIKS